MSDAITLDVLSSSPVQLDAGDADPIAREEIAALATRVTTVEGDVSGLSTRMGAVEGDISALGTTVDGIDARVEAIEADYVTSDDVMDALGGEAPTLVSGSSRAMLGDPETASWMQRTTAADGAALIESVRGNTLRWNQLADGTAFAGSSNGGITTAYANGKYTIDGTTTKYVEIHFVQSFAMASGHKYLFLTNHDKGNTYADKFLVYDKMNLRRIDSLGSLWSSRIFTADQTYEDCEFDFIQGRAGYEIHDAFTLSIFDLTQMFGAGNEPSTVAEFEALYPLPYYPYDTGSLLPVRMEGVETVGFNQWDEQWELGAIREADGTMVGSTTQIRSKNFIPVFPSTTYCNSSNYTLAFFAYDANKEYVGFIGNITSKNTLTTPAGCAYLMFFRTATAYNHDICINISDLARNGTYEPYWSSERTIPAATYFPQGMRSAGSVRDELRADAAVTRVGAVDLGTLDWGTKAGYNIFDAQITTMAAVATISARLDGLTCSKYPVDTVPSIGIDMTDKTVKRLSNYFYVRDTTYTDAAAFKTAMSGVMLYYELATPTTTPIDPPLPLSYRTGAGGTERVMVASGTTSAPPIFATRYPLDPADLAASIAPVDGPIAKTNHQVGDLIMLGFTLCKATQVIVTGETIAIGTNVTRTSVAAELAALSE